MDLTRAEFEQILDTKLEEKLEQKLDQKLANFPTRLELQQALDRQSQELKEYIKVENSHLVSIIQETIVEPMENRFDSVEERLAGVETKLDTHMHMVRGHLL